MKIMYVYPDFGARGGIERYILTVARRFINGGDIRPVVVCSMGTWFYKSLSRAGIPVYGVRTLPCFARPSLRVLDVLTMVQLLWALWREKPDAVHLHIGHLENLLFSWLGYPTVYTIHGYGRLYTLKGSSNPAKRLIKKLLQGAFGYAIARVNQVLCVSQAECDRMRAEGYLPPDVDVKCVPNAVSVAEIQAAASAGTINAWRESFGIPAESCCIAFINRLDENKNPLAFLELAQRLATCIDDKNLFFVIAGDGPIKAQVEQALARSPIRNKVRLLGHIENVAALLAAVDMVVHTPHAEGFGLGVLEAMAVGTPPLAYAVDGITGLLDTPETRSLLVPPEDMDTLTNRAVQLLNQTGDARNALKQALQRRAGAYDLSHHLSQLEMCYQRFADCSQQPLVSVILPVYQGEAYVLRAVSSVLRQTYRNLELIVVDDGSTDGTLRQLSTITDRRLRVVSQTNQGVSCARNNGIRQAKGKYLAFIDADDLWFPHKIETEMAVARSRGYPACIIYSGYYAVDERGLLVNLSPLGEDSGMVLDRVLEREGMMLPSTVLVHRQVVESVGGFPTDSYHEDRVFFIRACRDYPAYPTGKRLVLYRQTLSGRCRSVLKDFDAALSAELSIVESLKPVLPDNTLDRLRMIQIRNLLYRFLMYNFPSSARALQKQVDPALMTQDKKGVLALISLRLGINMLYGVRLLVQMVTRYLLLPWWQVKRAPVYFTSR